MKRLLFSIALLLMLYFPLTSGAVAQSRYIGVIFQGSTASDDLGINKPVGFGVRTGQPLGEHVVANGEVTYSKFEFSNKKLSGFQQHLLAARGDMRWHIKVAEHMTIYPRVGVDVQQLRLFGYGQTFVQPTFGAGANYANIVEGHYYYAARDWHSVAKLRGHNFEGNGYLAIPGSDAWFFIVGGRLNRFTVQGINRDFNLFTVTVGAGRKLGKH